MSEIYGHKWTSANGAGADEGSGEVWAMALASLTLEQIGHGIEACIVSGDPWPPSLPEFRMLCYGIPSFAAVESEILSSTHAERSPFARFVWEHVDAWRHRKVIERVAEQMRRTAYDTAVAKVLAGHPLPGPIAGVLEQQPEPKPQGIPEAFDARVQRMQELLGDDFNPAAAVEVWK